MHTGSSRKTHHAQLCEFILATPVGAVLESVDTEHCEDFYEYYLHDFVRSVHRCKHRKTEHDNMEYQVQLFFVIVFLFMIFICLYSLYPMH